MQGSRVLLILKLLPADAPVVIGADDTIERFFRKKLSGIGCQHRDGFPPALGCCSFSRTRSPAGRKRRPRPKKSKRQRKVKTWAAFRYALRRRCVYNKPILSPCSPQCGIEKQTLPSLYCMLLARRHLWEARFFVNSTRKQEMVQSPWEILDLLCLLELPLVAKPLRWLKFR